jgi:dTDP-4-dehydro-6-deoxy-alpha-D-glucopyranose 2,3-dehydratase
MTVRAIPLSACEQWERRDGAIRHLRDAFFSVVGVRATGEVTASLPLIDQPEIGILGFVVRRRDRTEILVQAKPEPGNQPFVQLAPSVQATESNHRRRHGGRATALLELVDGTTPGRRWSDSLQSEQGSRFLGKRNRNTVVEIPPDVDPALPDHLRWFPVEQLLALLGVDGAVNTDARSVLATVPWALLADDDRPFARSQGRGDAIGELADHYAATSATRARAEATAVEAQLAERRRRRIDVRRVALDDLSGWVVDDLGVSPAAGPGVEVRCYAVRTSEREVPAWDQPLAGSSDTAVATVLAQRRHGRLELLLSARHEVGLRSGVELGPTLQLDDQPHLFAATARHVAERLELAARARPLTRVEQTDEGGRFFRSHVTYGVSLLDDDVAVAPGPDELWVGLRAVEVLAGRPGVMTNELRTVISTLLAHV